jgi:hypothetical protein
MRLVHRTGLASSRGELNFGIKKLTPGRIWCRSACFGGVPAPNAVSTLSGCIESHKVARFYIFWQSFALNNETVNVLNYLKPDTAGGNFVTSPSVKKVAFQAPYDEVRRGLSSNTRHKQHSISFLAGG